MELPLCRPISRQQFEQLQAHAATQPDFVFLGSLASSGRRGTARGFSCLAAEYVQVPSAAGQRTDTRAVAEQMESLQAPYETAATRQAGHTAPFIGGWVGSLAYEFGYAREARLQELTPELPQPLMFAGLYLWFASEDLHTGLCYLWTHPSLAASHRAQLEHWLTTAPEPPSTHWAVTDPFRASQSPVEYQQRVQKVLEYIRAGDCYQANLSQSFRGQFHGDPWRAFGELSAANPTPYSAFLRHKGAAIVSASPERFLAIDQGLVETSPIKGTRPRGATPEQDQALAGELVSSEKDRAENLMIVDLLRNDLSMNALPGTVKVDELFALESYENVHHLVSHIRAQLKPEVSPLKALFDAFPGGSITGAPKIRAMQIIHELEPHWRGPYCGSVFYYGLDGRLDSSIAIRTLLCEANGTLRCWGGGGIVADSDPEAEYQETLTKVKPLMDFLEQLKL